MSSVIAQMTVLRDNGSTYCDLAECFRAVIAQWDMSVSFSAALVTSHNHVSTFVPKAVALYIRVHASKPCLAAYELT